MSIWRELSETTASARVGLLVGVVLIGALVIAAAVWALQERYVVLYTEMEAQDAAAVVEELERMKVPYRLEAGGSRIVVRERDADQARLKMVGAGLPLSGGVGFEIFDRNDFGMTEFAQRINYQRALQGELARTIMALREVKLARVHLVLPEASLFKKDQREPSASITLFLAEGATLAPEHIAGIQRLAASAVPGLAERQVTVADERGVTLTRGAEPEDPALAASSAQLDRKRAIESYLRTKAQEVVDAAFGVGVARTTVDARLNLDQLTTTKESVLAADDARQGLVRKREVQHSDAGAKSNQVTTELEYRLGRAVQQRVTAPGVIERLSVAVIVPADTAEDVAAEIGRLVAMAVGLDADRGDAIVVSTAPARASVVDATLAPPQAVAPAQTTSPASTLQPEMAPWRARAHAWAAHELALPAVLIAALVLVALLVLLVLRLTRARATVTNVHSDRERVLGEVRAWLTHDAEVVPDARR